MINNTADFRDYISETRTEKLPDTCNISNIDLLNLSGGIPLHNHEDIGLAVNVVDDCIYEVTISCQSFYSTRQINFITKEIYNTSLRVTTPGQGIGTNLFFNQIIAAKNYNFKKINVIAVCASRFNGHDHWARVGYIPHKPEMETFHKWCKEKGISYDGPLNEFLEDEANRELWKTDGFTWAGEFHLNDNSTSLSIFKAKLIGLNLTEFAELI